MPATIARQRPAHKPPAQARPSHATLTALVPASEHMRSDRPLRDIVGSEEVRRLMASARSGGPSGGGEGGMSPAERVARQLEDQIRHNPSETLYALDASGTVVLTKTGGRQDIALSLLEVARLRDTTLTHNHPAGNAFSRADIQVAAVGDVAEIRVVTPVARFVLRRPASGLGPDVLPGRTGPCAPPSARGGAARLAAGGRRGASIRG